MHRLMPLAAALLLTCPHLAAAPQPANPAPSGPSRSWKLAFVRGGDIWLANGDGSQQRLLIKDALAPAWSPDRKLLAFARKGNVWVADADGTHQHQLTNRWKQVGTPGYEGGRPIDISWEPRDKLVTFSRWETYSLVHVGEQKGAEVAVCTIYTVPSTDPKRDEVRAFLGPFDQHAAFSVLATDHPAWSPKGDVLAFVRNGDIWVAERRKAFGDSAWAWMHRSLSGWGWDITRLSATGSYDFSTDHGSHDNSWPTHLSWSPDGRYLVYDTQRINGSGYCSTYVLRIGRDQGSLRYRKVREFDGGINSCFSPDGKWIVYQSYAGDVDVMAQSVDGKVTKQLVSDGTEPAW